jgi:ATP-binding cassette, subfamily B, bacterial HlyB/CyaB
MIVDTGLSSLSVMLRLLGRPVDPAQLAHRFSLPGRTVDAIGVTRAAQQLDLKVRLTSTSWDRLDRVALPAIAELRDGRFVVVLKREPGEVLVADTEARENRTVDRATFEAAWTGRLIMATTRAKLPTAGERKFDITWFIPAVVKYRHVFGEVLAGSLFLQIFALASPLLVQAVIDKVIVHNSLSTLDVLAFGLVAIAGFEAALAALRGYLFSHTTTRINVELGARLFRHLLSLPMTYFDARRTGDTVARAREIDSVRRFLAGSALTTFIDLLFAAVAIVVMMMYGPVLAWIVIASIPVYAAISLIATPLQRRHLVEQFARGAESQAFLTETIAGMETVKSMAIEPQLQRRWEEQLAEHIRPSFEADLASSNASHVIRLLGTIIMVAVLWFGAKLVMAGDLTTGGLVAVAMLAGRVSGPVLKLSELWRDLQQFRVSMDRLGDLFDSRGEEVGVSGRTAASKLNGAISFDRVGFRYRAEAPDVLKQVSLEIPAGQVIGIMGPSGAGKSTLARLIQRLYVPQSGRVLIDGMDPTLTDPLALRRQIGVVRQESILFNRTVRENIAVANPGMDMRAVVTAATLAAAHDFILGLEKGYDTIIGERGSTLSDGQRQRIAIARALATDPRILILDEATGALDAESERLIMNNMRLICQGRTVIIITHRLSAVRYADRIITMESGQVVEDGSHEALLGQGGRYAALYRHQLGVQHDG